jgi:hypothetical protein
VLRFNNNVLKVCHATPPSDPRGCARGPLPALGAHLQYACSGGHCTHSATRPAYGNLVLLLQRFLKQAIVSIKQETDRLLSLFAPFSTDIAKIGTGAAATQER